MARGSTFSLAVPVLASIYHGLRQISSSSTPSQCHAILPMHYIYGWLGNYFDTYLPSLHSQPGVKMVRLAGEKNAKHFTAIGDRKLLRSVGPSQLSSLAMFDKEEQLMVDDGKQSHFWTAYTISLPSSYLTLRYDMQYIVESYSPHEFSRQFNFYQDIPRKLVEEACPLNLPNVVGLWQSCTKLGTKAKLRIPVSSHKGDRHWNRPKKQKNIAQVTPLEDIHIDTDGFFQDVPDSSTPLEDLEAHLGVNNLNLGDELYSQSSGGSIDGPDSFGLLSRKGRSVEEASRQISHEKVPIDMPKVPIIEPRQFRVRPFGPTLSDVSVFQGIDVIAKSRRKYSSGLWSQLSHKIEKTSLDHVDDIEDEAEKVLEEMRNMKVMDTSPLQRNLKSFFDNIRAYKNRSTSIKSCASQLTDISQTLSHAKIRENEVIKESELHQ
ncbi:uncharacterized protein LOC131317301 [Rhododendron vialii]|uniref:uncharacterized protein LOC131317301 n=1 Tax=Rhododendron vialii TaxID=182163 RepID=UPI00265FC57A|nr:uncharacterized protein LOC131317301 [Rhododendron vialii]